MRRDVLILDRTRAVERMVHMTERRWEVELGPEKRVYVVHSRTQMGALGEALHHFSMDTNRSLNDVLEFRGKMIAQVERDEDDVEGVAT